MDLEKLQINFNNYCCAKLEHLNLDDEKHKQRLALELKEIHDQMELEYLADLCKQGAFFGKNDNNLLTAYLLGLCDEFDINEPFSHVFGDFPDIDVDFIDEVKDYLKKEWAPKKFGREYVCEIGSYGTYHLKQALKDIARVYGKDSTEINNITTKLPDKDEDGVQMTLNMAIDLFPELKQYCDNNPEVAVVCSKMMGLVRQKSTHAAGMIISSMPLNKILPVTTDGDGNVISAFTEGQASSELGPLGFVKFDFLTINNLKKLAKICSYLKKYEGIDNVYNLPGKCNWTDTSYFKDKKAIALARIGKLKGIFQFDSDGIRNLCKKVGVDSLTDLVAINSLYRPGPMEMKMHIAYYKRKHGIEDYEVHPLLQPILGPTYGVLCWQEQILKVLNIVGNIPEIHCEIIRKAISKKNDKVIGKYKNMFIKNGQKNLGWTEAQVLDLWNQIDAFSGYGFNKSHSCGYAVAAMRLLCLKANYTKYFFAGLLHHEEKTTNMQDYKIDAESMGIKIHRLNLNKSKEKFDLVDGEIYIGFSNVKGIGEDMAAKIVANQPYSSFEDFLDRFGTSAAVCKSLIALGAFSVFSNDSPARLYEYYEYYKEYSGKLEDAEISLSTAHGKCMDKLLELGMPSDTAEAVLKFENPIISSQIEYEVGKIEKNYRTALTRYENKIEECSLVGLEDYFDTDGIEDLEMRELLSGPIHDAEVKYIGFCWDHPIQCSPDYTGGFSFAEFTEDSGIRPVEGWIIDKPMVRKTKAGGNFYKINIQDSNSHSKWITVWQEDYERFKEEFEYWESDSKKGHFLRIRIQQGVYRDDLVYNFESPPKWLRNKLPKEKKDDARIQIMSRPILVEQEYNKNTKLINMDDIEGVKTYE